MTLHFASISFPAFLALACTVSEGVRAQSTPTLPVVEYTFDNSADRLQNTGTGDTIDNLTLDGVLFPTENSGITFPQNAAAFNGTGCIEVPRGYGVNYNMIRNRTYSLDFVWDGTSNPNNEPQILSDTPIQADTWYHAAIVFDKIPHADDGTIACYLNGNRFTNTNINWFGINRHSSRNCLGGMLQHTRLFNGTADSDYEVVSDYGYYFHGQIDNFKLINSVEIPTSSQAGQTRSLLRGNHDQ